MEKLMTAFELCMLPDFYPSFSAAISLAKLWPLTYFEHHLGTSWAWARLALGRNLAVVWTNKLGSGVNVYT